MRIYGKHQIQFFADCSDTEVMIEEFLHRKDERETWAEIYRRGGEPLLRQWSKFAFKNGFNWLEDKGMEHHHGLRICATFNFLKAEDDEVLSLIHLIPFNSRPWLLDNPNSGVKIIETLWYGPYVLLDGVPCPDIGAGKAFMHHYDLAMHVFRTRPDLANKLVPSFTYDLFCFALAQENSQAS